MGQLQVLEGETWSFLSPGLGLGREGGCPSLLTPLPTAPHPWSARSGTPDACTGFRLSDGVSTMEGKPRH